MYIFLNCMLKIISENKDWITLDIWVFDPHTTLHMYCVYLCVLYTYKEGIISPIWHSKCGLLFGTLYLQIFVFLLARSWTLDVCVWGLNKCGGYLVSGWQETYILGISLCFSFFSFLFLSPHVWFRYSLCPFSVSFMDYLACGSVYIHLVCASSGEALYVFFTSFFVCWT